MVCRKTSQYFSTTSSAIVRDEDRTCVSFIRTNREGESSWMRLTEKWTAAAKSVFLFNTNGGVAHSTYAGLPWLRQLKQGCAQRIHFWPFDGWDVPGGRSVVAEVYPSLWKKRFPKESLNSHQQDAYAVAAWFRRADQNGTLPLYFNPPLTESERTYAQVEGWILGVV
jgi:hypothetical protein